MLVVFFSYFFSEAVLRQFILHRSGTQQISLDDIIGKLPPGVRDEVTRTIRIAELKDDLKAAKTDGQKINISIQLAGMYSPQKLQEKYAEVIDEYPKAPESLQAYINFLMAPETALKSISIKQYQDFIDLLKGQDRVFAWSSGLSKLKNVKASPGDQIAFLKPLLNIKPDCREYQQLYVELRELAFQKNEKDIELRARKLEDACEELPFFDEQLAKKAAAEAKKKAAAEADAKNKK
jgi:hypothetical protein